MVSFGYYKPWFGSQYSKGSKVTCFSNRNLNSAEPVLKESSPSGGKMNSNYQSQGRLISRLLHPLLFGPLFYLGEEVLVRKLMSSYPKVQKGMETGE